MNRYELKVTKAGTRMDDSRLFNLTVIDTESHDALWRTTKYEELNEYELNYYTTYFKELEL